MAELKTKKTRASVAAFLRRIDDEQQRQDCQTLVGILEKIVGDKPAMWGDSIIGFGSCKLRYASGRQIDWFLTGLSPRKQYITLYLGCEMEGSQELLQQLGKHKTGKGCLYIKRLADVDLGVLKKLLRKAVQHAKKSSQA